MKQEDKTKKAISKILNESAILFSEKGYINTSMQDIMNATGMSKGAIYHHFKSKEDILKMLTDNQKIQVKNFFEQIKSTNDLNTKKKILSIFEFVSLSMTSNSLIANNWIEKVPFALVDTLKSSIRGLAPTLSDIFQEGIDNGEITCENTKFASEVILILVDIWLDPILFQWDEKELEERFDYLFNIINYLVPNLLNNTDIKNVKQMLYGLYK